MTCSPTQGASPMGNRTEYSKSNTGCRAHPHMGLISLVGQTRRRAHPHMGLISPMGHKT